MIDWNKVFFTALIDRNKVFFTAFIEMDFFSQRSDERVFFHGVYRNVFFFIADSETCFSS